MIGASRPGGALFPVLILSGLLLMLSTMVPQILVSASGAMRNDQDREAVLAACESGVAIAEARLKQRAATDVVIGTPVQIEHFSLSPSPDSPDYGRRQDVDYSVRLLDFKLKDKIVGQNEETTRFTYRLDARAWEPKGRSLHLGVSGLLAVVVSIDRGQGGGAAIRQLKDVVLQATNRELPEAR